MSEAVATALDPDDEPTGNEAQASAAVQTAGASLFVEKTAEAGPSVTV